MIVGHLYIVCVFLPPNEADAELIIDPDRMLAFAVSLERFKSVCPRDTKVVQVLRTVDHAEFPPGDFEEISRKALWVLTVEDRFRHLILETSDHCGPASIDVYRSLTQLSTRMYHQ